MRRTLLIALLACLALPASAAAISVRVVGGSVADPAAWKKAVGGKRFTPAFTVSGDELVRVPSGYDANHPLADVLRLKDYTAFAPVTAKQVTGPAFLGEFATLCADAASFMAWQCRALDIPF